MTPGRLPRRSGGVPRRRAAHRRTGATDRRRGRRADASSGCVGRAAPPAEVVDGGRCRLMWRLAFATLRFRRTGQVAAFVAMALGTAIVLACGGLMETGIRTAVPPQQLAAAAVVVTGNQAYQLPRASPASEEEDDPGSATLA